MADFRMVTDTFSVAPQISLTDIEKAKSEGYSVLIMNRPDRETQDQPPLDAIRSASEQAGLAFHLIPITAPPSADDVRRTAEVLSGNEGQKVLAFCRSGTRSVTLWAYAVVSTGEMSIDDALIHARQAGYDLSPHRPTLQHIAG